MEKLLIVAAIVVLLFVLAKLRSSKPGDVARALSQPPNFPK